MCEGTALLHSGQVLNLGADQRFAPRRERPFCLEDLLFGTAIINEI
ncbi:MAG: hypothetical protein ACI9R3_001141 [Verrucomicrobiales bacterium]|jgi:hypothetical protein